MSFLNKTYVPFVAILLASGLYAAPLHAQDAVRATVPFSFNVGDKQFDPGEYTFKPTASRTMLQITGARKSVNVMIPFVEPNAGPGAATKLGFRSVGSQRFLSTLYTSGSGDHYSWPVSRSEKQALLAMNREAPPADSAMASNQLPH